MRMTFKARGEKLSYRPQMLSDNIPGFLVGGSYLSDKLVDSKWVLSISQWTLVPTQM